jgi:hypothetical protein
MSSKKRTLSRRKETEAISALRNYCAIQNLVFQAEPREDYGVDCYIEVALEDRPLNFLVGIQSRAGRSHRRKAPLKADFKIDLRPTDIQYWLAANYPIVLVYFDDVSKEQYFKHIQDEWERSDRKDSQFVTISESDRVIGENLANYLRGLVQATPNTRNRLEVVARPLVLEVNGVARELAPIEPRRIGDLTHVFRGCEEIKVEQCDGAFLLGYSADENWTLESRFEPCGMTGFVTASAFIHNLSSLRTVQFEILRWAGFENSENKGNLFSATEVKTRLNKAVEAQERVGFFERQVLYSAPQRMDVDEFEGPPLHLVFGTERFEICISVERGRQFVLLTNHKYRPPRTATLFAERIQPVFDPSLDVEIPLRPTPIVGVTEFAASASGKWLALTVTTNAENMCWGHPKAYIIHLETDRVRDACRISLL